MRCGKIYLDGFLVEFGMNWVGSLYFCFILVGLGCGVICDRSLAR